MKFKNMFKQNNNPPRITNRSNIIQYDGMGYPLRLCIMDDGHQMWVDTYEKEGDFVLKWEVSK